MCGGRPRRRRNVKLSPPVPCLLVTQPIDHAEPGTEPATEPDAGAALPGPAGAGAKVVQYKGAELDAARGPGLGCFRFQVIVLVVLLILTPIGVNAGWPDWLTAALLFITLALLLVTGQTIIFLLRLVAADRRGRRRPLASQTRTVGELDDAARAVADPDAATDATTTEAAKDASDDAPNESEGDGERSVRQ
jgi:hypothetical protein